MAEPIKITIYRRLSVEDFSKTIADRNGKADAGSSAAATAAIAASLLSRAASEISASHPAEDKLEWFVRNTEILRNYMLQLIDEDIKCRMPLSKALKEGDERKTEAAGQVAVRICLEIVNMMGRSLEIAEELMSYSDSQASDHIMESADLLFASSLAAGRYLLSVGENSSDEMYRYVIKRENELMMEPQKACYERIKSSWHKN